MRKFLVAVLLAGSATPAIAAPQESADERTRSERPARAERSEPRPARPQREERRSQPAERPQLRIDRDRGPPAPIERPQSRVSRDDRPEVSPLRRDRPVREPAEIERPERPDSVRDWRAVERGADDGNASIEERNVRRAPRVRPGRDLVEQTRPLPPVLDRNSPRRISKTPVPGTEPPPPRTATARHAEADHEWRTNWRRDKRYDWRDHRRRHKHKFRIGFYFDPFGWNYYRYGIGWRLWPGYYSSRYWLHDPWGYRLPPAYGPFRWVRYWDDALLVNIYTGQVVDVIYDFFW